MKTDAHGQQESFITWSGILKGKKSIKDPPQVTESTLKCIVQDLKD